MNINRRFEAFLLACAAVTTYASSVTNADILNWQTGEIIAGTENIVPAPWIDLSKWNKDGHNLRFADLEGLDLSRARFSSSWLDNARFVRSYLYYVRFDSATLTDADLNQANLMYAYFFGATLTGADLNQANLTYASFASARLRR